MPSGPSTAPPRRRAAPYAPQERTPTRHDETCEAVHRVPEIGRTALNRHCTAAYCAAMHRTLLHALLSLVMLQAVLPFTPLSMPPLRLAAAVGAPVSPMPMGALGHVKQEVVRFNLVVTQLLAKLYCLSEEHELCSVCLQRSMVWHSVKNANEIIQKLYHCRKYLDRIFLQYKTRTSRVVELKILSFYAFLKATAYFCTIESWK